MTIEIVVSVIGLFVTILLNICVVAYFAGSLKANQLHQKEMIEEIKQNFKDHFATLERKQDKHNNLIERMVIVEQSTKSAHHRIDDFEEKKNV